MKKTLKFLTWLFAILILLMSWHLYTISRATHDFDQAFLAGDISLPESGISLGKVGFPTLMEDSLTVPYDEFLGKIPRRFPISGPRSFRLGKSTTVLHVLTDFPNPELIIIQMPLHPGGYVNIYGPEGATVDLIIWQE